MKVEAAGGGKAGPSGNLSGLALVRRGEQRAEAVGMGGGAGFRFRTAQPRVATAARGFSSYLVPMSKSKKRLIVVGDRVLIQPEEGEDRTKVGLYLPATAVDNQAVQGGKVVATGPGNAVSAPTELDQEPWKIGGSEAKYVPLQARIGDYAIFFRRAAVEITFEGDRYLVVPQAAILTLVRESPDDDEDGLPY